MLYTKDDPLIKNTLGSPFCPNFPKDGCGALTYEASVGLYFCEVCDKEKMEEYFKAAKEKRRIMHP